MKAELLVPIIAFNITVMLFGFYRVLTRVGPWTYGSAFGTILVAVLLGAAIAGSAFFVMGRMNK